MTDLSIIILNWNTREDLRRCLNSGVGGRGSGVGLPESSVSASQSRMQANSSPDSSKIETPALSVKTQSANNPTDHRPLATNHRFEVIVVDNASSDGSPEMVRERFPWVNLIVNPENVGFSAGNNIGIRAAQGRYVLLLNPDTVVHEGALETLVSFADAHLEAGIIGPKLLNGDGSLQYSCRTFPNLSTGFFRETPLGRLFPQNRYNRDYLMTDWNHDSAREVDWVSGAAMLIRREVLDEIGGLDEGFFMYCEDVDLCYRAHQKGWKVLYCPDAVVTHLIARASDQNVAAMLAEHHKSMYRFFRKHYAATTNPFVWPLVVGGLTARALAKIAKNRVDRWRQARQARRRNQMEGAPPPQRK